MPRFDDLAMPDEPERKQQTKTKSANPFSHLDDLDAFDITGKAPARVEKPGAEKASSGSNAPHMPKASAASTKSKTASISPSDTMRDYLGRINYDAGDEISDADAAQRTGHARPQNPENLPDVVQRQDVPAVLGNMLQAAGTQTPEWHTINNLPGYMARNIRAMGRSFFSMFTQTPLEDIMTIANVEGKGPNSDAEIRAVGAWLMQNGEDLGKVEIDMGPAIRGYKPDVKEFRANGIRFHVVRDPMGQYIYAYPDQDAVKHSGQDRLGAPQRPGLPHQRESVMNNTSAIFEGIFNSDLEKLQLVEDKQAATWTQQLLKEMVIMEKGSTLSKLIGGSPGGQNLVSFLHKRDKLSSTAAYSEVTADVTGRVQWMGFKNNPDHFLIIQGRRAVVGIKPDEQYMAGREAEAQRRGKEYNPAKDNTIIYRVVGFAMDQRIDNLLIPMPEQEDFAKSDNPDAEYQAAVADVSKRRKMTLNLDSPATQISGKRGGKPFGKDPYENIMDRIKEVTGGINAVYTISGSVTGDKPTDKRSQAAAIAGHTPGVVQKGPENWPQAGGIERGKIAGRQPTAATPADFRTEFATILGKIRPVFPKLIQQAEAIIYKRSQRLLGGDNFDAEEKLLAAKKTLRQFKIAVDTAGDLNTSSYDNPIVKMIGGALREVVGTQIQSAEGAAAIRDLNQGGAANLGPVLDAIRSKLVAIAS